MQTTARVVAKPCVRGYGRAMIWAFSWKKKKGGSCVCLAEAAICMRNLIIYVSLQLPIES
jgi:hypothetical protein